MTRLARALLSVGLAASVLAAGTAQATDPGEVVPGEQDAVVARLSLRRALKDSTLAAGARALQGYEAREEAAQGGVGPAGNAALFHRKAEDLRAALSALRSAQLDAFPDPVDGAPTPAIFPDGEDEPGPLIPARRVTLQVTPAGPCRPGDLLDVEGTSRSGPFFHAAGGALDRLRPGRTYTVIAYLVFRREYAGRMVDQDVHVAEVK